MKPVDVVILTKNSERLLRKCIDSVYENVPVNRLIVVDGYSTDSTVQIVKGFQKRHGNVILIQDKGTRGRARQIGIDAVQSDWFLFVDSDIVLCSDWFRKASRLIGPSVGAVFGVDVPGFVSGSFKIRLFKHMAARVIKIRGSCEDVLIAHDAVKDIQIPSVLHTLEDAYIKAWISSRKYKVLVSYDAFGYHCKTTSSLVSKENRVSTIFEFRNFRLVRERLIFAVFFAFQWYLSELKAGKT